MGFSLRQHSITPTLHHSLGHSAIADPPKRRNTETLEPSFWGLWVCPSFAFFVISKAEMNSTKRLAGPCSACGRIIEYPAHQIGTTAKCPYCGQATELVLATPPEEPSVPKRVVVWTVVSLILLVGALAACFFALKWAQKHAGHSQRPATQQ